MDLLLTNKPKSFQVTNTTETGLSDHHKLISSFMKVADVSISNYDPNENYSVLSDTFSKLVDKHGSLKKKNTKRKSCAIHFSKDEKSYLYPKQIKK